MISCYFSVSRTHYCRGLRAVNRCESKLTNLLQQRFGHEDLKTKRNLIAVPSSLMVDYRYTLIAVHELPANSILIEILCRFRTVTATNYYRYHRGKFKISFFCRYTNIVINVYTVYCIDKYFINLYYNFFKCNKQLAVDHYYHIILRHIFCKQIFFFAYLHTSNPYPSLFKYMKTTWFNILLYVCFCIFSDELKDIEVC